METGRQYSISGPEHIEGLEGHPEVATPVTALFASYYDDLAANRLRHEPRSTTADISRQ